MKQEFPMKPVFFLKPETALVFNNRPIYYPDFTSELHYEAEIILKICKVGKNIQEKFAHTYFDEISVGLDMTARDIQRNCMQKGLPWEISKGFEGSAPIGKFVDKSIFNDLNNLNFHLNLNETTVQKGNTNDLIFTFDKITSYISQFMTLKIGDIIFTGTPVGVGPVKIGDKLEVFIEGNKLLSCLIK